MLSGAFQLALPAQTPKRIPNSESNVERIIKGLSVFSGMEYPQLVSQEIDDLGQKRHKDFTDINVDSQVVREQLYRQCREQQGDEIDCKKLHNSLNVLFPGGFILESPFLIEYKAVHNAAAIRRNRRRGCSKS